MLKWNGLCGRPKPKNVILPLEEHTYVKFVKILLFELVSFSKLCRLCVCFFVNFVIATVRRYDWFQCNQIFPNFV